jgi:integrase/recombinase XerD
VQTVTIPVPTTPEPTVAYKLSYENLKNLQLVIKQLTLKAYSNSTIRTYRGELMVFFQVLSTIPADKLTTEDVKRYLLKCLKDGLTENTLHSRINALKFYYEQVLGRDKFFVDIPRPKKAQQLPNVLGEQEITRLFNAVTNKKHKAILFLAYSAGLRVSEVINMKLKDIDSDRMQLFIERSKGKKDRYVNLSPIVLDVLRKYIQLSDPKPTTYLFEGQVPGSMYSARAAQKIFQMARSNAGIKKDVTFHSLRHSFATHILEKGIDIRYIKDILGHFNIKTTERYLHVKREQLINIISPLDDIWKKGNIEW